VTRVRRTATAVRPCFSVRRLPFCVAPARFARLSVSLFLTARRGGLLPTGLVAEADRRNDPGHQVAERPHARAGRVRVWVAGQEQGARDWRR
jgi:hypothetical protein